MEGGRQIHFTSHGLDFTMGQNQIHLPKDVVFVIEPTKRTLENTKEVTTIQSDTCDINRDTKIALFGMSPLRSPEESFVHLRQPNLLVKSRTMSLDYSNSSKKSKFQYLVARGDVYLQEKSNSNLTRYGTSGRAAFESARNVIVLTEFPQLYQDNDTVAGDVIIMHRDSDIVEVEKSNAFNQGEGNR